MNYNAQKGFTLLELTAALLITSLIVLAIASSLAAISDSWERGERLAAAREVVRVLSRRLGTEMLSVIQGQLGAETGFEGDRKSFSFIASGEQGPRLIALTVAKGRISLRERALRQTDERVSEIILAEQVDHLDIYSMTQRSAPGKTNGKRKKRGGPRRSSRSGPTSDSRGICTARRRSSCQSSSDGSFPTGRSNPLE